MQSHLTQSVRQKQKNGSQIQAEVWKQRLPISLSPFWYQLLYLCKAAQRRVQFSDMGYLSSCHSNHNSTGWKYTFFQMPSLGMARGKKPNQSCCCSEKLSLISRDCREDVWVSAAAQYISNSSLRGRLELPWTRLCCLLGCFSYQVDLSTIVTSFLPPVFMPEA